MNTYLLEHTVIAIGMAGLSGFIIGAAAVVLFSMRSASPDFDPSAFHFRVEERSTKSFPGASRDSVSGVTT